MLQLRALLTFLSRVLRSVVAVAVAHRQQANRPTDRPTDRTTDSHAGNRRSNNHNEQHPTRWLSAAEAASCFAFGFWPVIIRLSWPNGFIFFPFVGSFCHLLCFCPMLPVVVVVVLVVVAVPPSRLCVMCAVRMAPVDESVSLRILHEADASSSQSLLLFERSFQMKMSYFKNYQ